MKPLLVGVMKDELTDKHCYLAESLNVARTSNFIAADPLRMFGVNTARSPLVTKKVELAVTDGILTGTKVTKPSELLALLSLPVDVAKAIVSIPAGLLTFKIEQVQKENELSEAEAQQLKNLIELIKQKQALEDAQDIVTP